MSERNLVDEIIKLHEANRLLHTEISELKAEVERLKAELAGVYDAQRAIMSEPCGNERHCTCVPPLRAEVERLKAELAERDEEAAVFDRLIADLKKRRNANAKEVQDA